MLTTAAEALGQQLTQPSVLTLQVSPLHAIALLLLVLVLRACVPRRRRRDVEADVPAVFLPVVALVDAVAAIIGYVVESVIIHILESERIQNAFVSASCAVLQSPKFRVYFQEFLESEHVKESCARVVQVVAETPEVAQGIHVGALNTGMIAALGVARQVPLVGRFVPKDKAEAKESPLSPRVPPPQAYMDLPSRARFRSQSADIRDRGLSSLSASTKASSQASSSDD